MKCTCKGLLAFAGGIAMISSAAIATPTVVQNAPAASKSVGKMAPSQTVDSRVTQQFEAVAGRGDVTCPPGAIDENEPDIADGGEDVTNGGCFMASPQFSSISIGEIGCGRINTYATAADPTVFNTDTDWWQFTLTETTEIEYGIDFSGFGGTQFGILVNDCANLAFIPGSAFNIPLAAAPFTNTITLTAGTYNFFVRTAPDFGLIAAGYPYNISLNLAGQTPGACCDVAGNCVETIEADCDTLFTPNVTCAEVTCPTIADCPKGGIVEGFFGGEILADGYTDTLNSGCNAPGGKAFDGFAPVQCGETVCGTSGVHTDADGGTVRDQDWFLFDTAVDLNIAIDYTAAYDGTIVLLRLNSDGSCPTDLGGNIIATADTLAGGTSTLNATIAPGSYSIFAQATTFDTDFLNLPYQWTITTCDTNVLPVGCCFSDGSCQDLLPGACETAGGFVQQVVCAEVTCPIIAANDVFEGALPVNCGDTFVADLATASPGGVEFPFSCGFGTAHTNSLWYSFVAADTVATVTTCGVGNADPADDSTIDVYSFDGTDLTEVGCGEDSCTAAGGGAFLSTVNLTGLTVGDTYFIRIAAWDPTDVAAYNVEVTCAAIPVAENDVFEGAVAVNCGDSFTADLTTATPGFDSDGFPFACQVGGTGGTNTLWYSFVADDTQVTITTCASDPALDSIIDLYSFDGTTLTELGCNDDDEIGTCVGSFLSTLQVSGLTVGDTYFLRIGAWGTGTVAEYTVEIICGEVEPPVVAENDTFDGALPVACDSTFLADLRTASPGTDGDGFPFSCRLTGPGGTNTLWYSFVATGDAATITTCASTAPDAQDSIIDAFSFDGTTLTEIGCNDDDENCSFFLSTLELTGLTVGDTYYIRIGAWGTGSLDEYQVDIACASGCDPLCADATGEGDVNLDDLNLVLTNFGRDVTDPLYSGGDVNCDGAVNLDDLNLVLTQFGTPCN